MTNRPPVEPHSESLASDGAPSSGRLRLPTSDPGRLSSLIAEFAALSAPGRGVTRLAYTDREREAHDKFGAHMKALGLDVWVDSAGNTLAEHSGSVEEYPAIGTGSHLDSVPGGGRFDGIAGVVAAMEVARIIVTENLSHRHHLRFVAFAAEEGARFGQACIGSRLAAGLLSITQLDAKHDAEGLRLSEAMSSVGVDPHAAAAQPWDPTDWAAFVELHVEQGGVLEKTKAAIGIVDLISGSTRLDLNLTGRASHTGATPMSLRADALAAAAEIVLATELLANDARHRGTRATVGRLVVTPGSITTIPGHVSMSLDVRDVDSDRQRATASELLRRAGDICAKRQIDLEASLIGDSSPVVLPLWLRQFSVDACKAQDLSYRVMTSGASHDAQAINQIMPASMIFIPSRDGLSHVPEEWTSSADLATGTDVLLRILLRADEELATRRTRDPGPASTTDRGGESS